MPRQNLPLQLWVIHHQNLSIMKKGLFCVLLIISSATFLAANHFIEGEQLTIYATSGLKLRSIPSVQGKVLAIMNFGETVTVSIKDTISKTKNDQFGWVKGQWVRVEYRGIEGYAFDGFLSHLPFQSLFFESVECQDLAFILAQYANFNFKDVADEELIPLNKFTKDCKDYKSIRYLDNDNYLIQHFYKDAYESELILSDCRMMDAYNLTLALLELCPENEYLKDSFIFKKESTGDIHEIISKSDDLIKIIKIPGNKISIKFSFPSC